MKKVLIVDASNLLYRTFFAHIKDEINLNISMCHHATLTSINNFYNESKADEIVLAFDSYSWRKSYTSDLSKCITNRKYKGTRRSNMTPSDKVKMEEFDTHIKDFINMFKEKTGVIVLQGKYLEADDLIAGYMQMFKGNEYTLISSDKDFMQLLGKHNLKLIDPISKKERTLADYNDDPDYFIFEKCIRGDDSDNVMSSYPRLRKTVIQKAYEDSVTRTNIMQHSFSTLHNDENGIPIEQEYLTQDVFEENVLLMDLTAQPNKIKELIGNTILDAIDNRGKFNYLEFMRFCGKHELHAIRNNIDSYVMMLSNKKKAS
jgi:hypothetical protein